MGTDFLKIGTVKKLKKHIQNICNSYSHPWDILAELAQNSVDAIKLWNLKNKDKSRPHEILIEVNQKSRSIIIKDTGIGIDPKKAPSLLGPDGTDKDEEEDQIGEKGVGLTFALFSSNKFMNAI